MTTARQPPIDINAIRPRLAQRLLDLRTQNGWSLDALEERTGVSRSTLSRIERAVTDPTTTSLAKMAAAYGRTASGLLSEAEVPRSTEAGAARRT